MMTQFEKIFLDSSTADVHFQCGRSAKQLPAHKLILGVASPVFHAMFYGSLKEGAVVKITDVAIEPFEEFLQFFYKAAPTVTLKHAGDILYLAEKYDMPRCTSYCFAFLADYINPEQVMLVYTLAVRFGNKHMAWECEGVIRRQFTKVTASDAFLGCPKNMLNEVVALSGIFAHMKLKACVKWSRNECLLSGKDPNDMKTIRATMGDSFASIDFKAMNSAKLYNCLNKYAGLLTYDEVYELLKFTLLQVNKKEKVVAYDSSSCSDSHT